MRRMSTRTVSVDGRKTVRPNPSVDTGRLRPSRSADSLRRRLLSALASVALAVGVLVALPVPPTVAATSTLTLDVISGRTEPRAFGGDGVTAGDPVDAYKFLINADNTGYTSVRNATGVCSPATSGYPKTAAGPPSTPPPTRRRSSPRATRSDLAGGLDLPDGNT